MKIYSNAAEVELFLNGKSLGKQNGTDRIFRWPAVTLAPGENNVRAVAGSIGFSGADASIVRARIAKIR